MRRSIKKDERPPLVRMVGENGLVLYPKMVSDGNGGWKMADPEAVAKALGTPKPRRSTEKG